jgi:HSP20 family protein
MNVRDLIPWGRNSAAPVPTVYRGSDNDPFLSLHREVNRLFDDAFRGLGGLPGLRQFGTAGAVWPQVEISDTDKELRVIAELPGLEEKDVEILLDDGVLSLRGEKRAEIDDNDRHFSERFYGRFERRVQVGRDIEEDKVTASFKNGVLTVTLPKSAQAQSNAKRIAING